MIEERLSPDQREWLRVEIDRRKRIAIIRREIAKLEAKLTGQPEYDAPHRERLDRMRAALRPLLPPRRRFPDKVLLPRALEPQGFVLPTPQPEPGYCAAFIRLGPFLTGHVLCSRRASVDRFCRSHARRRVGEAARL